MGVKDLMLHHGKFKVNNGEQTRFWEDVWIDQQTLMRRFPELYRIVRKRGVSVASVLNSTPLNVSFRRGLAGERLNEWLKLVSLVLPVNLNNDKDSFIWQIKKNGVFSTQSLYRELMKREKISGNEVFWKAKLPLKIKIFLWYLKKGVILTKDNLSKRRWKGDTKCSFCGLEENIQHLFFDCRIARSVWNMLFITFNFQPPKSITHMFGSWIRRFAPGLRNQIIVGIAAMCWVLWLNRNDVVFQSRVTNSCLQVLFRGTFWIRQWSMLSEEEEGRNMKEGCRRLEGLALQFFGYSWWWSQKRIEQ
jgi:hypothetical protein